MDVIATLRCTAYHEFTVMKEFRYYLELLLDHRCSSTDNCPECLSLQRIYQFMQTEIFSTIVYTETPLDLRQPARLELKAFNRAAAVPRRPPAA